MADLSALGALRPVEPLNLENYQVNRKAKFQLPPKGKYTLQTRESFPAEAFGRTRKDALSVAIDPTIVGPTGDGYTLKFSSGKIYNSPWKNKAGEVVTQVGNYLMAHGVRRIFTDEQQIADAVESTAGRTFEAILDWKAGRADKGFEVDGMENFPLNPDGTYQSWVNHPTEKDEKGEPKRVFANLEIVYFIPAETT